MIAGFNVKNSSEYLTATKGENYSMARDIILLKRSCLVMTLYVTIYRILRDSNMMSWAMSW